MNITYLWTRPSGYMTACVRALADMDGVNVTYFTWDSAKDAPFLPMEHGQATHRHLVGQEKTDDSLILKAVQASNPDAVVLGGWRHAPYVHTALDPSLAGVRFVLGMDTPIRFDVRQFFAPLKLRRLMRRVDAWCVPGERGYQLTRYWRIPECKVYRLLYGIDYRHFGQIASLRPTAAASWPKRFLFVGRYAPVKGVDVLVEAYRAYRTRVTDPWPLDVCGAGSLASLFDSVPGITDHGFVQPIQLAKCYANAGVFILPSRMEPWGQVVVEAAATGLPLICTQRCGAAAELVRDFYNGFVVPPEAVDRLTDAMVWVHRHSERLPEMGAASCSLAKPYAAERWAENQLAMAITLCNP